MSDARDKPVCLLGMPSYGGISALAAHGYHRASLTGRLTVRCPGRPTEISVLTQNFNTLWCWALNVQHRGDRVDYFSMQHADVEPEPGWLDVLIQELEARDLDMLGVVVPLKNSSGNTSAALAADDGDPFKVHCRLTLSEIFRLPETFTSQDVGRPLLLNTGLWVCRFNDWAKRVCFQTHDRNVFDPVRGWVPENESEDWNFSRQLHALGLKLGCTRKVQLTHRGPIAFGNASPWGEPFDRDAGLPESVIPGPGFPADVPGWLSEEEGAKLADLARDSDVLEIGSYCGRSTVCLARTARSVLAVDTFDGRGTSNPGETLAPFLRTVRRYGVAHKVRAERGTSAEVLPRLPAAFDLAFVDGSHDRDSVLEDAELATRCLRLGGLLVFHDYGTAIDPGVTEAVDELVDRGALALGRVGSLVVVDPDPVPLLKLEHVGA